MQYSALAPDQQTQLDAFLLTLRPLAGEGARYVMSANALVPNKTGLAGAQPLAKEDIESIVADLQTLVTTYLTPQKQQLQAKACGAANLISGR